MDLFYDIGQIPTLIAEANHELLLILSSAENTEENVKVLTALTKAIGLDIQEKVTVFWVDNGNIQLGNFMMDFQNVIVFGLPIAQIGLQISINKVGIYPMEHFSLLYTYPLNTIVAEKEKKMLLWSMLQKQFLGK